METRSVEPDTLDQIELNELKTGQEPEFIAFLASIAISASDIDHFPSPCPMPDALNRLITAFNLGIHDGSGLKNCLITIGSTYQDIDLPPDYSPARVMKSPHFLDQLDLVVLVIAVAKVKAAVKINPC